MLRGVNWRLENSLNLLAFSLKSDTIFPSIRRGGIIGIFLPLKKVFRIDQYFTLQDQNKDHEQESQKLNLTPPTENNLSILK